MKVTRKHLRGWMGENLDGKKKNKKFYEKQNEIFTRKSL